MPTTTSEGTAPPATAAGGRPHAAAAVWDWRRQETPAEAAETPGRVRRRAAIEAAIGAAVGGLVYLWRPGFAWVVWSIAALVLAAALISPTRFHAAIRRGFARLGNAVGQLLAVVFLVPLFFGFFAVFGALFRRGRRDRMEPRFDPRVPSYWKRRPNRERTLADFERMF